MTNQFSGTVRGLKTLFVYTQAGCEVCEEAKKYAEEFKRDNRLRLFVVYVNATNNIVSLSELDPKSTPAYGFVDEIFQPIKKHEGLLNYEQLQSFVYGDFGTLVTKKRARRD